MFVESKGWYGDYDRFFDYKNSTTINNTQVANTNGTLGFLMFGNIFADTFCLGPNSSLCYISNFTGVESIDSLWLYYFNLQNIGGILGLGFNEQGGGDFWHNNSFPQQSFGVQLTPNASDWSWMANPPNISEKEPSFIEFGNFDVD